MNDRGPRRLRPLASKSGGRAAVFLDRDGVLNDVTGDGRTARSPRSVADVRIADGAAKGVDRLRTAGFVLIAVTNQPDVARGLMSEEDALAITDAVADALQLDDAYVCVHDGPDACACRKPRPGLLTAAAVDWELDLASSWLIGDRWVDIAAASAASVRSVLLDREYSMESSGGVALPAAGVPADAVVTNLDEAVTVLLASRA